MERTEYIQKAHDLRAEQLINKLNYTEKIDAMKKNHTAIINEKTKRHKAELEQLNDEFSNTLKQEKKQYDQQQQGVENRMLKLKLEYFKDHPFDND
jgi:hypothetical protein